MEATARGRALLASPEHVEPGLGVPLEIPELLPDFIIGGEPKVAKSESKKKDQTRIELDSIDMKGEMSMGNMSH